MVHFSITTTDAAASGIPTGYIVVGVVYAVIILAAGWKMYVKAGQPGIAAIIPVVNAFGLLKIAHRPLWWLILLLIPFVNVVVIIILMDDVSKAFGHGLGMTLVLILLTPIGYLALGFGASQYQLEKDPLF